MSIKVTPRPTAPNAPDSPFTSLAEKSFTHPTYGTLKPCLVPNSVAYAETVTPVYQPRECDKILNSFAVQRILGASNLSIPTYIIPWKRTFVTHLRLSHFSGNLFNATVLWSNADTREQEGRGTRESGGDLLIGFDERFEVEWVHGEKEGLAFKGGFWGKEGLDSRSPEGIEKESAEVWFAKK